MPKKGPGKGAAKAAERAAAKRLKKKCCVSKDKCRRCPLLALKQGTLPAGYTVKKRKLVKLDKKRTKLPTAA